MWLQFVRISCGFHVMLVQCSCISYRLCGVWHLQCMMMSDQDADIFASTDTLEAKKWKWARRQLDEINFQNVETVLHQSVGPVSWRRRCPKLHHVPTNRYSRWAENCPMKSVKPNKNCYRLKSFPRRPSHLRMYISPPHCDYDYSIVCQSTLMYHLVVHRSSLRFVSVQVYGLANAFAKHPNSPTRSCIDRTTIFDNIPDDVASYDFSNWSIEWPYIRIRCIGISFSVRKWKSSLKMIGKGSLSKILTSLCRISCLCSTLGSAVQNYDMKLWN